MPKIIQGLVVGLALFAGGASRSEPVIGSANTVTADPPVSRPPTTPCEVLLFGNVTFADFSPKTFQYAPPAACRRPWAKIVLEADFDVTAGRQFDRTANIWIGGTNVYFGTTAEPSRTVARSWHVERDLTDYSALLAAQQPGEVDLGNLVNRTYTSVLHGSATLQFYPAEDDEAPAAPDLVLTLGRSDLGTSTSLLSKTFTLPTNVELAYLDVIAQSQANDEFWYSCSPNDVAALLGGNCGATGFREGQITIDGKPAGVAPIYPWIYTGGVDPFLWRPIPSVQTLNFVPYRVELTPFAGLLSDGKPHTVAVSVFNSNHHFTTTATLLVFLDHRAEKVTGEVTQNTLSALPTPTVVENFTTSTDGKTVRGTVDVTSSRHFTIAGTARTSHGKVRTEVTQTIDFSNHQEYVVSPPYDGSNISVENILQTTTIASLTKRRGGGKGEETVRHFSWPLKMDIAFTAKTDGSGFQQTASIRQSYDSSETVSRGGEAVRSRVISNMVAPTDTLFFDANFRVTGNKDQTSRQRYFAADSEDSCYSRLITAANGVLTAVTDGQGCEEE
jgi:hypothetical protein